MNPFSWTKNQLGGFIVLKVEDEDLRRELEIALEGHDTISGCRRRLGLSQSEFKDGPQSI